MDIHQLQIQIGEHLSNGIQQLDYKLNNVLGIFNTLSEKIDLLQNKVATLESRFDTHISHLTVNYKNKAQFDESFDTDTKRKVSAAKKERELQHILEKEKERWEQEILEKEQIVIKARELWEHEKNSIRMEDEIVDHQLSYIT
jgi:hypothetical protein